MNSLSTSDLKANIIKRVHELNDEVVLTEIYNLIQAEADMESSYTLTEAEKKMVEEGLEDFRLGKVVTSEKANELLKEWRKK